VHDPTSLLSLHDSANTTHVCWLAVETKVRTNCCGVPTRKVKVDHWPSIPSQFWSGVTDMGTGITVDLSTSASARQKERCIAKTVKRRKLPNEKRGARKRSMAALTKHWSLGLGGENKSYSSECHSKLQQSARKRGDIIRTSRSAKVRRRKNEETAKKRAEQDVNGGVEEKVRVEEA
jgi:hypothetical protein